MHIKNLSSKNNMPNNILKTLVFSNAFLLGIVLMSFEMLCSCYLNPYFGNSIYTWAAIISTVMAALATGYFIGGYLADRSPSIVVLGIIIFFSTCYMLLIPPLLDNLCSLIFNLIPNISAGALISCIGILFIPLTILGMVSPFGIRLIMLNSKESGAVSGLIYGISTIGNIFGVLFTTFFLIPRFSSMIITYILSILAFISSFTLLAFHYFYGEYQNKLTKGSNTKKYLTLSMVIIFFFSLFTISFLHSPLVKKYIVSSEEVIDPVSNESRLDLSSSEKEKKSVKND